MAQSRTLAGGAPPPNLSDTLDYITIGVPGACTDFGNYTPEAIRYAAGTTNGSRGMITGGLTTPNYISNIEYITIGTTGNSVDYGAELSFLSGYNNGADDGSRAVTAGGHPGPVNTIDYFNISSGNAAADFGDLLLATASIGGCGDGSRAIFSGGDGPVDTMQYVTVGSTGNAADFGELQQVAGACASTSGD